MGGLSSVWRLLGGWAQHRFLSPHPPSPPTTTHTPYHHHPISTAHLVPKHAPVGLASIAQVQPQLGRELNKLDVLGQLRQAAKHRDQGGAGLNLLQPVVGGGLDLGSSSRGVEDWGGRILKAAQGVLPSNAA